MQIFKNFTKSIKSELKLSNFGFEHDHVDEFYKSQWQLSGKSFIYLIYRWVWALFFTGVFLAIVVLQFSEGKLFIFLTNWGIILCVLTNLIGACIVTCWHITGWSQQKMPIIVKIYWLLHGVTVSLALVISTVYWIFLHGKMNKPNRFPEMSFITHCLNSVFMLVDFLVVAFPVRILHTVYSMMLPIIYCLFTVVYFFCGGVDEHGNHYVYPILDWKYPVRGIITFAGVFGLYVVFGILLFIVYKIKRLIYQHGNHYVYPILDWKYPVRGIITFAGVFGLYVVFGILLFIVYKIKRLIYQSLKLLCLPDLGGVV